ncbi:DUF4349 domain-containing protein [Subtercola sp. Z020]|uniref:DUF4349 domain-containing protein n=1 Tax=Subtercola sp. Z020 TaxID=2080582 RepID=UPI000CE9252A|nr:DUF4349 domain-containing protein [Subtercola sp. Z020]PPF78722.1 DUF4349 domain-containing protein [Subtercola sp. Z020]
MKRKILVIGVLASTLLLAGCSAFGSSSSNASGPSGGSGTSGGSSGTSEVVPDEPGASDSGGSLAAGAPGAGRDAAPLLPDAQVVTTGTIALRADDPVGTADRAVALATGLGGHVDNRTEQSSGQARADLVLRIPSARVDEAVDGLKTLATVDSVAITATDVTAQVSDVNARITALQTSVNRLLDLMAKASDTTDLIALESTLSERQADLDGLTAQKNAIADTVQYSSITVSIARTEAVAVATPGDFWSGLGTGWSSLVTALSAALVAFGVLVPWLVTLGVIALAVLAIIRLAARRPRPAATAARAATATPAAATPAATAAPATAAPDPSPSETSS